MNKNMIINRVIAISLYAIGFGFLRDVPWCRAIIAGIFIAGASVISWNLPFKFAKEEIEEK